MKLEEITELKKYQVWVRTGGFNVLAKTYPHKLQAYVWCWLNGYVNKAGRLGYILDDRVEIRRCE